MRCRDSARQSCTDKAQTAVLTKLNEGVRGFHAFNPNRGGEGWQAVEKIERNPLQGICNEILLLKIVMIMRLFVQGLSDAQSKF